MIKATPAGDAALLIDTDLPPAWLAAAIGQARLPGVVDIVPGARTVLVIREPGLVSQAALAAAIAALPVDEQAEDAEAVIEIPVTYDGLDLADVASLTGLSVPDVVALHTGALYTVGWLGFMPGFGYLTGLDPRLSGVRRLETPRLAVPAGSVAIAAGMCAVYPSDSPGGWRLLGRTAVRMWDSGREPAALLAPGRRVRFIAVRGRTRAGSPGPESLGARPGGRDELPLANASAAPSAGPPPGPAPPGLPGSTRFLEVLRPGPLATVQDLGRHGLGAFGVPPAGAADAVSLIAANRLAGNTDGAAGVELTLGRAAFRCVGDLAIAMTGAPATATISMGDGESARPLPFGSRAEVPDGSVISVGAPSAGVRSYVAVAGGLSVPQVLGSRSTDLLSGLGGDRLQPGAMLPVGADRADPSRLAAALPPHTPIMPRGAIAQLRIIAGPRLDWFSASAFDQLCSGLYTVTAASNRTGLRLDGQPVPPRSDAELPSEGLVTGALQVPPGGMPILLLADHPTVGGYPVIAVLVSADIGLAAQLRPGDRIRFTGVSSR